MKNLQNSSFSGQIADYSLILTAAFSFVVIVATFFISNCNLSFETKTTIFAAIAAFYPLMCAVFYFWQRTKFANFQAEQAESAFNEEIEHKLLALEEANEFFGASLKFSDMFRLVASRIDEIVPFSACVLYLRGEDENILQIKYAVGENSRDFMGFKSDTNKGLAVKALLSGKTQIDELLLNERQIFPPSILRNFQTAAAIPLTSRGEAFGVLTLYADSLNEASK